MLVRLEYIATSKIGDTEIPVYITDESVLYVGKEIIPFLKNKTRAKQLIITNVDDRQYSVFPFLEVCKYLKKDNTIEFPQKNFKPIKGREEQDVKVSSDFLQTLMKMRKIGLKKDE